MISTPKGGAGEPMMKEQEEEACYYCKDSIDFEIDIR
jgi:hypothetical protein